MRNIKFFYDQLLKKSSLDFIECSKIKRYNMLDFGLNSNPLMQNPFLNNDILRHSPELGNTKKINLTNFNKSSLFRNILKNRESSREFSKLA